MIDTPLTSFAVRRLCFLARLLVVQVFCAYVEVSMDLADFRQFRARTGCLCDNRSRMWWSGAQDVMDGSLPHLLSLYDTVFVPIESSVHRMNDFGDWPV